MTGASLEVVVRYNHLGKIKAAFPREVNAILNKATQDVYRKSQITVPVRKDQRRVRGGALKNSGQVTYDEGSMTGEVSYTIHYAIYVHEGTRYMAARPFLTNALTDAMPGLNAAIGTLESRLL